MCENESASCDALGTDGPGDKRCRCRGEQNTEFRESKKTTQDVTSVGSHRPVPSSENENMMGGLTPGYFNMPQTEQHNQLAPSVYFVFVIHPLTGCVGCGTAQSTLSR